MALYKLMEIILKNKYFDDVIIVLRSCLGWGEQCGTEAGCRRMGFSCCDDRWCWGWGVDL